MQKLLVLNSFLMIGICENECFLSLKKKALDSILVRTNALDIPNHPAQLIRAIVLLMKPHFPYERALLGQVGDLEP